MQKIRNKKLWSKKKKVNPTKIPAPDLQFWIDVALGKPQIKFFFGPATKALTPPPLELSSHIFGGDFFGGLFVLELQKIIFFS